MSNSKISRRGVMGAGLLAASAIGRRMNAASGPSSAQTVFDDPLFAVFASNAERFQGSFEACYDFLDAMMDAYATGSTIRLIQSYSDQSGLEATGFTYDNAVAIDAYLARGRGDDLSRAEILGNGLLHAQATNFPVADGRFAQAYFVNKPDNTGAYITPAAGPFYFYTSAVGDQAWAGMALAQLYRRTRNQAYLTGALKAANWIVANTYNTLGAGGYSYGAVITPSNQSAPSTNGKSTEHNIDVYAFFTMLSELTRNSSLSGASWSGLAKHALTFVEAMFNSTGGFFYTGTEGDQITIFTGNIPEDVQTWSYLALLSRRYGVSIDWVITHLITIDTPSCPNSALSKLGNIRIEGETFASASLASNAAKPANFDPEAVWLEGTAHTVDALLARRQPGNDNVPLDRGDIANAYMFLENLYVAQQNLGTGQTVNSIPLTAAQGLVAATGNLDTGFGYGYFPNLHIGATGWYALALQGADPFQLGYSVDRWY